MTTRKTVAALALAAAFSLPTGHAGAQAPAPTGPGEPAITMDDARRIAAEHGLVRIEEIRLDSGHWEIEGRDAAGADIDIVLRAGDGAIIRIERERPASALLQRP